MTALLAGAPAFAQEDGASGWNVTITPRYQQLLFLPNVNADGLESMSSYGASVNVRNPDGRFGFTGTYLQGKNKGTYSYDDSAFAGDYDYRARRKEFALQVEYTPAETGISFIAGYQYRGESGPAAPDS